MRLFHDNSIDNYLSISREVVHCIELKREED